MDANNEYFGYITISFTALKDASYVTVEDVGLDTGVILDRNEAIAAARAILKHYGEE